MHVVVAGHICLDLIPHLPPKLGVLPGTLQEIGTMSVSPGGCVFNTGQVLAELGLRVTLHARAGDDAFGDLLKSRLEREPLTANLVRSPTAGTSYSIVLESPETDRSFWHHVGASAEYDGTGLRVADLGAHALHVGYPSLLPALLADAGTPLATMLARAQAAGILTSLDLVTVAETSPAAGLPWRSILQRAFSRCDLASPSIDDLQTALRDTSPATEKRIADYAEWILDAGAGLAAISAGERGSYIAVADSARLEDGHTILASLAPTWAGYRAWISAEPVKTVVTTNGAGDAHSAGMLAGLVSGFDPHHAARLAARAAAATIQGQRSKLKDALRSRHT